MPNKQAVKWRIDRSHYLERRRKTKQEQTRGYINKNFEIR